MNNELLSILIAVRDAPKECGNCVAFCQEGRIDIPCKGTFDCEDREEMKKEAKENEVEKTVDNLPSCNNCAHNGTWDCIKCSCFDKYEKRG